MTPKWIFEKDSYTDGNIETMIQYCKDKKLDFQLVDFVFGGHDQVKWKFADEECVITYGTIHLAKYVQHKKRWYPGAWADWDALKCSSYLAHWGKYSVQTDYMMIPFSEVYRRWNELFVKYASDGHLIIRPDDNDKRFTGEKVSVEKKEEWFARSKFYEPPIESLTLIARPLRVRAEWRFIISNKKVVTGSLYRVGNNTAMSRVDPDWDYDKNAIDFADEITNSTAWQPSPIYCLDVCMLDGGEFKLMEIGSVNTCGLYKCDVTKIIDVANELALHEWHETHERAF